MNPPLFASSQRPQLTVVSSSPVKKQTHNVEVELASVQRANSVGPRLDTPLFTAEAKYHHLVGPAGLVTFTWRYIKLTCTFSIMIYLLTQLAAHVFIDFIESTYWIRSDDHVVRCPTKARQAHPHAGGVSPASERRPRKVSYHGLSWLSGTSSATGRAGEPVSNRGAAC